MTGPQTQFDVVIVGGGHNGLTCAAYLAEAGISVAILERRDIVGGAAITDTFHPGFKNSVCSYTVGLLHPQVIRDLDLHAHGLEIVERRISNFFPLPDGNYLKMGGGLEATQKEVARFSKKDAETLPAYYEMLDKAATIVRDLTLETPPNVGGGWSDIFKGAKLANRLGKIGLEGQRDLMDLFSASAADFLSGWFEDETVKAAFGFDGIVGTYQSPYAPGTAYVLLHHVFGEVNGKAGVWGHAIGGMGAISQAIAVAAEARGVTIIKNQDVTRISDDGQVETSDGTTFRGKAVAAAVNPKLLFSKMIDRDLLSTDFTRRMDNWKCASGVFRMNVALRELPDFTALPGKDVADHHTSGIIIGPSLAYMDRALADARAEGWSKEPIIEMLIPSTLDTTLAPEGQHVASLFCQYFDPDLIAKADGTTWDDHKEAAADHLINVVNRYAPNFKASVLGRQVLSPLDLERDFGLIGGDIFHGALTLNQMFSSRPMLGHGDYRMPVRGLYLCASGAHPGGGVTGLPGRNAAREIIGDIRSGKV